MTPSPLPPDRTRRRFALDWFDWGVLILLLVLSAWVMVGFLVHQGAEGRWTGTNGVFVSDQMSYLAWIEVSAKHILISDPFAIGQTPSNFLHPGFIISGLLVRLGMTPGWAYLSWTPVAVVVLFFGTRAFIRAALAGTWSRRAALLLSLLYISPAWVLAMLFHVTGWSALYLLQSIGTESWPTNYLWGYQFTAIALGSMAWVLLLYERDRRLGKLRWYGPLLGILCAWLQPWMAATLIGILVSTELLLFLRGERQHLRLFLTMVVPTMIPLGYYAALGHFDWTWAVANRANLALIPFLPWKVILISLAPLLVLSVFALRPATYDFGGISLRIWPVMALGQYLVIYFFRLGTFPLHSLDTISIPLAVLGVEGARRISHYLETRGVLRPRQVLTAGIVVLFLLVVPSVAQELHGVWTVNSTGLFGPQPALIAPQEVAALQYLRESPSPGGVLTQNYLGQVVPEATGRQTWLGAPSWTPNFFGRLAMTNQLFTTTMPIANARHLVKSSGARFLLSSCFNHANLTETLGPLLRSVHRFGCATVYEVHVNS